jgi:hypothetical protein
MILVKELLVEWDAGIINPNEYRNSVKLLKNLMDN